MKPSDLAKKSWEDHKEEYLTFSIEQIYRLAFQDGILAELSGDLDKAMAEDEAPSSQESNKPWVKKAPANQGSKR